MNTKILMMASSAFPGIAGVFGLFAPEKLLKILSLAPTDPLPVVIQIMGALYCSFALMNWTVKDNIIGGIYLRPISLANFAHFTMGALTLIRYQLSNSANHPILGVLIMYVVFAIIIVWLVFFHTGIVNR